MSAQQSCLSGLQSAAQRGLSEEISGALRSSPYYFVLRGSPPTEDPAPSLVLIEEVVRACGAVPRHKICFTRIKIDPLQALFKGNSTRLSRTRNAMPPHTDSSYETEPHELVVFQIVRADPAGGETILVPVDAVVGHLAAEAAAALSEPVFPFGSATHPILAPHEA
ncbi:MAG: TauD/TfdA family dioxygenase, partial [Pseudomonadota bacterium]